MVLEPRAFARDVSEVTTLLSGVESTSAVHCRSGSMEMAGVGVTLRERLSWSWVRESDDMETVSGVLSDSCVCVS